MTSVVLACWIVCISWGQGQYVSPVHGNDAFLYLHENRYPAVEQATPTILAPYTIVEVYPHDPTAFTEGLFFHNGSLYESTGIAGASFVRSFKDFSSTLIVHQEFKLPSPYFGEGIAILSDRLYVLTYKAQKGFILDKHTLRPIDTFDFKTDTHEGWGMTTDGECLLLNDGSAKIYFFNPNHGFRLERTLIVKTRDGKSISYINEMEYIRGEIVANVWFQNVLLRIDPSNGYVVETIDLSDLRKLVRNVDLLQSQHDRYNAVMNGIAYHPERNTIFVTGKLWDTMFELELPFLQTKSAKPNI